MKRIGLFWAALCIVAAFATACGGSDTSTEDTGTGTATATASPTGTAEATTAPAPAGAATITITTNSFGEPITVPPGAQITIKNEDPAEHSVTSDTGKFDVHVDGTEEGTLTAPTEPGEYPYHCTYHPSMQGTLIVK